MSIEFVAYVKNGFDVHSCLLEVNVFKLIPLLFIPRPASLFKTSLTSFYCAMVLVTILELRKFKPQVIALPCKLTYSFFELLLFSTSNLAEFFTIVTTKFVKYPKIMPE